GIDVSPSTYDDDKPPLHGEVNPANGGVFDSSRMGKAGEFDHVAFVRISTRPNAKVPVEILDDQFVEVKVQATSDPNLLLRLDREAWGRRVSETYLLQVGLFEELKGLASRTEQRGAALKRAKAGL